jgi:hypothetical protein
MKGVAKMKKVNFLILVIVSLFLFTGCNQSTQDSGEKEQESIMKRAREAIPTPKINNFLTRKAVSKWMKRMDTPSKIFYIYVLTDMGAPVGYFSAQYKPVSTATFLTPTKREIDVYGSQNVLGPAPALDGTYYGSGGNSNQYFWFDAETDALIELKDLAYIISDQPLSLDVPRIHVEEKGGE